MAAAMEHKTPSDQVPLWELHFHLWNKFSDGSFISGQEYMKLSTDQRDYTLRNNARVIIEVADEIGFSGVTIPDGPWDCIYTLPSADRLTLAKYIADENPDFLIVAAGGGVIAMPDSSNYVEFCYTLMDEPEKIDELCRECLRWGVDSLKRYADVGIRAVYAAADMADNKGQFFSDSQMDRFILPYLSKWAESAKLEGIFPILHTDGNITEIVDVLSDTGICAIQAIDPVAGMDMAELKNRMGNRICLCGNIDCGDLLTCTPDQIYDKTRDLLLKCKSGGCFVLGASNAVVIDTPKENYMALIQAWNEFGTYG